MNITFANKKLKKLSDDERKCIKELGKIGAHRFFSRLNALQIAHSLEDVRHVPGKFHELKGDRKGMWACDLVQPYRLTFIPHEEPIPCNSDGQYMWSEIKGVEIIEIIDYH